MGHTLEHCGTGVSPVVFPLATGTYGSPMTYAFQPGVFSAFLHLR